MRPRSDDRGDQGGRLEHDRDQAGAVAVGRRQIEDDGGEDERQEEYVAVMKRPGLHAAIIAPGQDDAQRGGQWRTKCPDWA